MIKVGLKGVGTAVPKKVITNQDLEKMVDTTDEWITTRTGIRERYILEKEDKLNDLIASAAKDACRQGNQAAQDLDFVICATLTPDRISPAQACEVAREIGANNAFCFDVNAACSGMVFSMAIAESFLKTRPDIKNGLVTTGEQVSRLIDYSDRNSCILFGDAATALVLTNDQPEHVILATELGTDPTQSEEVVIGGVNDLLNDEKANFYFRQNGKAVFKFAVNKLIEMIKTVPLKAGLKPEQIRYVIPHQANIRIIEAAAKEFAANETEFIVNIDKYGNTSSSTIGLALSESWDRFNKGDYILLVGFGAGLSWAAALIEW